VYVSGYRYEGYSQTFPENVTGLHAASIFGLRILVAKLLLEKGADVNSRDSNGQTPLSLAAEKGHEAVVALLHKQGADVDSKDKNGQTPLSWATESGHEAAAKRLLEQGAEVNSKDKNGQTPLSWAAENGHEAVMTLLQSKSQIIRTPPAADYLSLHLFPPPIPDDDMKAAAKCNLTDLKH
jgi:ankyrin repeat protein